MEKASPITVELDEVVLRELQEMASHTGQALNALLQELTQEALRIRRYPGIVFTEGPAGRRTTLMGPGLDVWEVIAVYLGCDRDRETTLSILGQLTEQDLEVALAYYQAYPDEIEAILADNVRPVEDRLWEAPHLKILHF